LYGGYFIWGSEFKEFHTVNAVHGATMRKQALSLEGVDSTDKGGMTTDSGQGITTTLLSEQVKRTSSKDGKKDTTKAGPQLGTWKGFIKYESSFVLLMFLELLWNRIDTILVSFIFTESEIATQASWMNVVMVIDCFGYGFGVSIASSITAYIVQDKIYDAKKTSIIANAVIFVLGCVFGSLVYFFAEEIASCLIIDPITRETLSGVLRLYSPLIPIELMQGSVYATVRAINKTGQMIITQIFANYLVHFVILISLISATELRNDAIVYSCGATYLSMCLGGMLIALRTDWTACAKEMRDEMQHMEMDGMIEVTQQK
jgi:Na+-driven multidrug efflux pump